MRTNIILDDALVAEAFRLGSGIRTKRELIETALREFIRNRTIRDLRDLKGKIRFVDDYDYKQIRQES